MALLFDIDLSEVNRIVASTSRTLETVVREFGQDLAEEVVRRTPVDTGFLRASWFTSLNTIGSGDRIRADSEKSTVKGGVPAVTQARLNIELSQARAGDTLFILNSARYATFVEFGLGPGLRTPRRFVASTVEDASAIADETIARIRRRR